MQSAFPFKMHVRAIRPAIRACMIHEGLLPIPRGLDGRPLPTDERRILPDHIRLLREELHKRQLEIHTLHPNEPLSKEAELRS